MLRERELIELIKACTQPVLGHLSWACSCWAAVAKRATACDLLGIIDRDVA